MDERVDRLAQSGASSQTVPTWLGGKNTGEKKEIAYDDQTINVGQLPCAHRYK